MPSLTVSEIATICRCEYTGDGARVIRKANTLEDASSGELAFVSERKHLEAAQKSKAGCLITFPDFDCQGDWAVVRAKEPRRSFATVARRLQGTSQPAMFRHPTAVVAETASIGRNVFLGAFVVVGEETIIEDNCHVSNHVSIGDGVHIGAGTLLHPHVVIYAEVRIGARCILHSGCVIGADGFGFVRAADRYEKFPQIGTVEMGDDVEIGANTCIDRAALGTTRVGEGTKLDNLIHLAHNCQVGRHVVIAAQTGFSGGVSVGDYAVVGGQVGVGENARIESGAVVGSQGGILPKVKVAAGEPVWGTPARPLKRYLRNLASLSRLAELRTQLRTVIERVQVLESRSAEGRTNESLDG